MAIAAVIGPRASRPAHSWGRAIPVARLWLEQQKIAPLEWRAPSKDEEAGPKAPGPEDRGSCRHRVEAFHQLPPALRQPPVGVRAGDPQGRRGPPPDPSA